MRKFLSLLLAAAMMLAMIPAVAETTDAVSSASVADFYGAYGMTGDDLMNALNSFSGFYSISTVNEDGSPLVGFFIYGCVKHEDKYYLQFGLAENQTRQNLVRTGEAVAMYAAAPGEEKPYAVAGARIWAQIVTDEALLAELNTTGSETVLFFEVTDVRSLG